MTPPQIHIKQGRIVDPANNYDAVNDLFIHSGKIAAIGNAAPAGFKADLTIDAHGLIVCPGLIDLCARLREPGTEHKATISSETLAAAKAGITTICLPPDTDPIIDEPAVVELIQKRAHQQRAAQIVTLGALTTGLKGQQLSEMAALKQAGCVGVSNVLYPVQNSRVLRQAMEYAATHELRLHVVPLEHALANHGVAHEGAVATLLGLKPIPVSAETVAIAQHLALIEEIGIKTHFGRLSSARAVEMIADAKHRGLPVTADVAVHHLHLTEEAIAHFNSQAHVIPPLRTQRDRDALLAGIKNGVIDAICSDHQPHEADAKLNPFPSTEAGISGLDTLLSLSLRAAEESNLSLLQLLKLLTSTPAAILDLPRGTLTIDAPAGICIFDPLDNWQVSEATMRSRGKNSPFIHHRLPGRVIHTLINGYRI